MIHSHKYIYLHPFRFFGLEQFRPMLAPKFGFLASIHDLNIARALLRKRRRQQYHSRKVLKAQKGNRKAYKTIDGGAFEERLAAPRRTICIGDKLKVIEAYEALMCSKRKAKEIFREPKPLESRAAQVEWIEKRKAAKKIIKMPALKQVKEQFPNVIQGAQLCKWIHAAERECWRDLPEVTKARCSATPNTWRKKVAGLALKGKRLGSTVPMALQIELDKLMADMSSGTSNISERKELVTAEHVASSRQPTYVEH